MNRITANVKKSNYTLNTFLEKWFPSFKLILITLMFNFYSIVVKRGVAKLFII